MIFRGAFAAAAMLLAMPAMAWTGSTVAGDYRVTAQLDGAKRLQSVSLVGSGTAAARPMQLHAWYVDDAGIILGAAPLVAGYNSAVRSVAFGGGAPVPLHASNLVVLAQMEGLSRAALASTPAVVAEIALP